MPFLRPCSAVPAPPAPWAKACSLQEEKMYQKVQTSIFPICHYTNSLFQVLRKEPEPTEWCSRYFGHTPTAATQRMQAGLPKALKTQDGWEETVLPSEPPVRQPVTITTSQSGLQTLHRWPWLLWRDSKLTPRRKVGAKR